ncbi:transcriptional regulator [Aureimonas ureilytica]|uniref:Transcriptional regulator n=1 Tax=Aureimonas ureilytica TaxID=401562 RepID=A0A175RQC0_9HYPH|nr:response regulator transcription factor [Aureimonas ureilytica]KTR05995.1 transcriptional regulator [Aureimonas ureilytica]
MSLGIKLLVVDDDAEIRHLLGRYLEDQGFEIRLAADRRDCESRLAAETFDLVVLDVMLPDGSGLDLCREVKDRTPDLAIILLTALKEDIDRIIGLELGADDYLVKPFNPRELVARIRAVLRRGGRVSEAVAPAPRYRFESFHLDTATRRVRDEGSGQDIDLTGAEFDLLVIFLERPGRVLSRDMLMDLLHGRSATDPFDRTIDVTMSRLRKKIGDNGVFRLFKTVRNGGYQFAAPVEKV